MRRPKLGRHLEWHGNRIRVVVRVPPSQTEKVGATKLRQVLETVDRLEAEREKVDVIRSMRARLAGEKQATVQHPLTEDALRWREVLQEGRRNPDPTDEKNKVIKEALDDRVDQIKRQHGEPAAQAFAAVAIGIATPLGVLVDQWFEERRYSAGYKADVLRAIGRLEAWCAKTATSPTIEAIKGAEAGDFVHAQYIRPKINHTTANKDISCLHSYWRWLGKRRGFSKLRAWSRPSSPTAP